MQSEHEKKKAHLINILTSYNSILVAFSAGVDSSLLLAAAGSKVVAVTLYSPFIPRWELAAAAAIADRIGVPHVILQLEILNDEAITANTKQRCYHFKKTLSCSIAHFARAINSGS